MNLHMDSIKLFPQSCEGRLCIKNIQFWATVLPMTSSTLDLYRCYLLYYGVNEFLQSLLSFLMCQKDHWGWWSTFLPPWPHSPPSPPPHSQFSPAHSQFALLDLSQHVWCKTPCRELITHSLSNSNAKEFLVEDFFYLKREMISAFWMPQHHSYHCLFNFKLHFPYFWRYAHVNASHILFICNNEYTADAAPTPSKSNNRTRWSKAAHEALYKRWEGEAGEALMQRGEVPHGRAELVFRSGALQRSRRKEIRAVDQQGGLKYACP